MTPDHGPFTLAYAIGAIAFGLFLGGGLVACAFYVKRRDEQRLIRKAQDRHVSNVVPLQQSSMRRHPAGKARAGGQR